MSIVNSEFASLRRHWPDVELLGEGERKFALLPTFKVMVGNDAKVVSALLQPWANGDGYSTRLYFSEPFTGKGQNWNVFNILGRTWHACSYNGVPAELPWVEIIACHLKVLQ